MQRKMELAIGDGLRALIDAGPAPATSTFTALDPSAYTDLDAHRTEMATIAASPVAAIASSELAAPGDFVTAELAGVPVIISRDRDGRVHAMRNVCAHRGATVETRTSGSTRIFSCGFHSWSYELDGALRNVTDEGLYSTEPCTEGLRRLACEERHGIVWVTPDATAAAPMSVGDWLGTDVDDLLRELGLGNMVHHAAIEYDLDCNWKLLTDGFLEIYHLKYLHRSSIAPYFPANLLATGRVGDHFVGWLPKNRLVTELTETSRDDWQVLDHLTGAIVLVPGTVVQWQAGHVELFSLRPHPTDPTRSTARLTMLVPADRADETDLWDRNWQRVNVTIPDEDFAAAVDVQRNIDAGAVDTIRIGANERFLLEHLDAVRARCAHTDHTAAPVAVR
jgi:phenylpropionate dioxygenase-like ring-hydroxylating dioxygenase large terminal subunit